jgi:hypothetical protein
MERAFLSRMVPSSFIEAVGWATVCGVVYPQGYGLATDLGAETLPVFFMPDSRNAGRPVVPGSTAVVMPARYASEIHGSAYLSANDLTVSPPCLGICVP